MKGIELRVGIVGLSEQGAAIARRIARSGFDLVACDSDARALAAFEEPGARLEQDPLAVADQVDVLCVCVRSAQELLRLVSNGAVFRELDAGSVFIVHSLVEPALCRDLWDLARNYDVDVLDAGITGSCDAALSGQLSVFVGGEPAVFERVRPLLSAYGTVTLWGPAGRGMEAKLLSDLLSIVNYGTYAAALELGERLHLDSEPLRQLLLPGSAGGLVRHVVPAMALHAGFAEALEHCKLLAPASDPAMHSLLQAARAVIDRLDLAKNK